MVDTGSTDGTPAIAAQAGAGVFHFEWCDDFAAARNAALERACGRWILQIDADERLTAPGGGPTDAVAFRRQMANPSPAVLAADAVVLPVRSVLDHTEEVARLPRLFRRRPGLRYTRRVHETLFGDGRQAHAARLCGGPELLHLGYASAVQDRRGKVERNLRLCKVAMEERPDDPEMHYYLAQELQRAGCPTEALEHFAVPTIITDGPGGGADGPGAPSDDPGEHCLHCVRGCHLS